MAKIRIYELAKQLNMTNRVLLEKLKEMNVAVKSHMSGIDKEAVESIKETLFQKKTEEVVEKRIKGTVIRRRRKVVPKEPEAEAIAPVTRPEEELPAEPDEEHAPEVQPEEPVAGVEPPEQPPSEPVEIEPKAEAKGAKPAKKAKVKKKPKGKKEQPAKIIKMPEVKPVKEATPEKHRVEPAPTKPKQPKHLKLVAKEEKPAPPAKGKLRKKDRKRTAAEEEKPFSKKKTGFRKKEILDRADLYDDKAMSARKGRRHRRGKVAIKGEKPLITTPKAIKRRIKVDEAIMVSELAKRMGVKAGEVIKQLMVLGVMVTLNQAIDFETATVVASEFDYETERVSFGPWQNLPVRCHQGNQRHRKRGGWHHPAYWGVQCKSRPRADRVSRYTWS